MQLIATTDCIDGKALCGECGGLVLVLTTEGMFPEGDVYLFNELCAAVDKSLISPLESAQLALAVADTATASGDQEAFDMAAFWLPKLAPLRSLLTASSPRTQRALSMLDIILWERSKTRSSGIIAKARPCAASE